MTDYARIIPTEPQRTSPEPGPFMLYAALLGWAMFLAFVLYPVAAVWVTVDTWRNPPWSASVCVATSGGTVRCPD